MARRMSIEEFTRALAETTWGYTKEVTDDVKKAVDIVAQEANEEIKNHVTFNNRTGKYLKSFRIKTTYEDSFYKTKTWYVAAPHYRLTHLLEFGHDTQGGGRTKAYPHIKYGEELAKRRMEELVKGAVER